MARRPAVLHGVRCVRPNLDERLRQNQATEAPAPSLIAQFRP